ncbi:MBL fold metallo-hydrolase [Amycolatopsis alkalitolerans]|uniref:MBL fold metallo-hydrolase n=1 Tax=Amycolatopsis alkalitolerans TaxID=2547244 RepID=A0A5C4LY24_9PSEU|nr:MBL fold metallo-hydrolase [Amycolatopsis alkalitolerans]TNC23780.1 MBL fold metallo-hydrolase [Amycolatopsis alkalitolerans]
MQAETKRWHEPGPHPVAEGVYRVPLSLPDDGLRAVNTYVLEDGAGITLIDPGQYGPLARKELGDALAGLGYGFADVRRCLVTHIHRDHYSQAVALRREFGCRVSLGEHERDSLAAARVSPNYGIDPQLRTLPLCGAAELVDLLDVEHAGHGLPNHIWEDPDEWLADGDTVGLTSRTLRVAHTPGHTRGHVTLHDRDAGLVFSGDHILPQITPSIGFEPVSGPLPLADFQASLRKTRGAPEGRLAPAHGPVTGSVHERVGELLAHHENRLRLTLESLRAGSELVYEVALGLRWTRRERKLDDLDPLNRMLAVLETKAHLDVLVRHREAHCETRRGLLRYVPVTGP